MRKAGVSDYEAFARKLLKVVTDRPISFEVFADDFPSMIAQGRVIASWGRNVNVKVPVTNTKGDFAGSVIRTLSSEGMTLNVTAIMTVEQVSAVAEALDPSTPAIVSVFAGRIADTGRDPVPHMRACKAGAGVAAESRTFVGQPARTAQHFPGRRDRLRDHHRHQRCHRQAAARRQRPRLNIRAKPFRCSIATRWRPRSRSIPGKWPKSRG